MAQDNLSQYYSGTLTNQQTTGYGNPNVGTGNDYTGYTCSCGTFVPYGYTHTWYPDMYQQWVTYPQPSSFPDYATARRVEELEAKVAQLEQMLQTLMNRSVNKRDDQVRGDRKLPSVEVSEIKRSEPRETGGRDRKGDWFWPPR